LTNIITIRTWISN